MIGLGSIGREVVKRARAFEMRVRAHDPYVTAQFAKDLGIQLVSLSELYKNSDYITVHVSLTPETDRLLNEDAFAQMKTGVRIVNCARGELLDELALKEAIESGKVAGASLDVFSERAHGFVVSLVRAGSGAGDAAHRRFDRRSPGDRGRADRGADR